MAGAVGACMPSLPSPDPPIRTAYRRPDETKEDEVKQVIQGLIYDTDTAEDTGVKFYFGEGRGETRFEVTKLYRTRHGRWSVAGEGGPRSRWGQTVGNNHTRGGEGIQPLSEVEAKAFAEAHGGAEDYERLFDAPEAA